MQRGGVGIVSMIIILFLMAVLVSLFFGRLAEVIGAKLRRNLETRAAGRPAGKSEDYQPVESEKAA